MIDRRGDQCAVTLPIGVLKPKLFRHLYDAKTGANDTVPQAVKEFEHHRADFRFVAGRGRGEATIFIVNRWRGRVRRKRVDEFHVASILQKRRTSGIPRTCFVQKMVHLSRAETHAPWGSRESRGQGIQRVRRTLGGRHRDCACYFVNPPSYALSTVPANRSISASSGPSGVCVSATACSRRLSAASSRCRGSAESNVRKGR